MLPGDVVTGSSSRRPSAPKDVYARKQKIDQEAQQSLCRSPFGKTGCRSHVCVMDEAMAHPAAVGAGRGPVVRSMYAVVTRISSCI